MEDSILKSDVGCLVPEQQAAPAWEQLLGWVCSCQIPPGNGLTGVEARGQGAIQPSLDM